MNTKSQKIKRACLLVVILLLIGFGYFFWANSGSVSYTATITPDPESNYHNFTVSVVCTNTTNKNALATLHIYCSKFSNSYTNNFPLGIIPAKKYISKNFTINLFEVWKPTIYPESDGYTEALIEDFLLKTEKLENTLKSLDSDDFKVSLECSPSSIRVISTM